MEYRVDGAQEVLSYLPPTCSSVLNAVTLALLCFDEGLISTDYNSLLISIHFGRCEEIFHRKEGGGRKNHTAIFCKFTLKVSLLFMFHL